MTNELSASKPTFTYKVSDFKTAPKIEVVQVVEKPTFIVEDTSTIHDQNIALCTIFWSALVVLRQIEML